MPGACLPEPHKSAVWHCLTQLALQLFTEKSERLKQAKKEAEKEIAAYRQQREEAYKKQISDVRQRRRGLKCVAMPNGAKC